MIGARTIELTEAKGSWSEATSKNGVGKRSSEVGMAAPFDESTSRITYTVCFGGSVGFYRSVSVGGTHALGLTPCQDVCYRLGL